MVQGKVKTVFLSSKYNRCGLYFEDDSGKEHCCSFPSWRRGVLVRALAEALGLSESIIWSRPTAACRGRQIEVSAVEIDGRVFYTLPAMERKPSASPKKAKPKASPKAGGRLTADMNQVLMDLASAFEEILKRMS